jgi:hypothetical protein
MNRRPGPEGTRPTASAARGTLDVSVAETPEPRKQHEGRCPWDCVRLGLHRCLTDSDDVARATWCPLCDRAFTLTSWSKHPTPRKP